MSREPIDIQDAVNHLARSIFDLTVAFHSLAGFVLTKLTDGDPEELNHLANYMEQWAADGGRLNVTIAGDEPLPNEHLMALAAALRQIAVGERPAPFTVIDGGRSRD